MTSLKNSLAKGLGIAGAVVLAPFIALFGLVMLGLGFGLSLIAVLVVAVMARGAQETGSEDPQDRAAQPAF